jgi:hypothetical protein
VASDKAESIGCLVGLLIAVVVGMAGWEALKGSQVKGDMLMGKSCPFGAELAGSHPPQGTEEWCQEQTENGSYRKHGVSRSWYSSGPIREQGSYVHGKRDGRWTYWNSDGTVARTITYDHDRTVSENSTPTVPEDSGAHASPRGTGSAPGTVALVFSPIDGEVFRDGKSLGSMPVTVNVGPNEFFEVEIRREAFYPRRVRVDGTKPVIVVQLTPIPGVIPAVRVPTASPIEGLRPKP